MQKASMKAFFVFSVTSDCFFKLSPSQNPTNSLKLSVDTSIFKICNNNQQVLQEINLKAMMNCLLQPKFGSQTTGDKTLPSIEQSLKNFQINYVDLHKNS